MPASRAEWWWVAVAFVFATLFYANGQPVVPDATVVTGATAYHDLARQLPRTLPPKGDAPEVFRFGIPLFASLVAKSQDWVISAGFERANLAWSLVCVLALTILLRRHVRHVAVRGMLLATFLCSPYGPVRHVFASPVDVWPAVLAVLLTSLLLLEWCATSHGPARWALLGVIVAAGTLMHEIVLLVGLCSLAATPPQRTDQDWRWVPLIMATSVLLAVHLWIVPTNAAGGFEQWLDGFGTKGAARYALACGLVFGPLLCAFVRPRVAIDWLRTHAPVAWYVGLMFVAAWGEVGHAERILVLALPVMLVVVGRSLDALMDRGATVAVVAIVGAQLAWSRAMLPFTGPLAAQEFQGQVWERVGTPWVRDLLSYPNLWSATMTPAAARAYAVVLASMLVGVLLLYGWTRRTAAPQA